MGEAREELYRMLNEDELRDAMLLVFTNKQVNDYYFRMFLKLASIDQTFDAIGRMMCKYS